MDNDIEKKFIEIQNNFIKDIKLKNSFEKSDIKLTAGVDLAYWEVDKKQYAVCCIVVVDFITKKVIESINVTGEVTVPYVAGFLAFRELPLVLKAVENLKYKPDLFLFDGNGYLHQRHMGIATHASFYLNTPTIGVAKSYLKIEDYLFDMPENESGSYKDIIINGEVYGRALRTHKDVKPIFVSCGNYIDLDMSSEIVMDLISNESRLPIPVRLADLETHKVRQKILEGNT